MNKDAENNRFDISRRDQVTFKHYQISIKLLQGDQTRHHILEIFTNGQEKLLELRRIFAKTHKRSEFKTVYNLLKNN